MYFYVYEHTKQLHSLNVRFVEELLAFILWLLL